LFYLKELRNLQDLMGLIKPKISMSQWGKKWEQKKEEWKRKGLRELMPKQRQLECELLHFWERV
jgi:hypothetical protein